MKRLKYKEIQPNDKFGRWTVQNRFGVVKTQGVVYWCVCDCGTRRLVRGISLNKQISTSCGCFKRENFGRLMSGKKGEASWNVLYADRKKKAVEREHSWHLTLKKFKKIASKSCHWCGAPPRDWSPYVRKDGSVKFKYSKAIGNSLIKVNGIDRKDNDVGYTTTNAVPCCPECNFSKGTRTQKEFLDHVKRVSEYQNSMAVKTQE
jgi:hypothetical protein